MAALQAGPRRFRPPGAPLAWFMANDEGHGFLKKSNADFQFCATVAFVQQFLITWKLVREHKRSGAPRRLRRGAWVG